MNNITTDSSIMAALGRRMTQAVARETVAASNLANIDTPGFRAREMTFGDALDAHLGDAATLATTNSKHLGGAAASASQPVEAAGLPMRRDGNNVQLDREMFQLNLAAGDFSAAQTALAAKFRLVRYAINEGR